MLLNIKLNKKFCPRIMSSEKTSKSEESSKDDLDKEMEAKLVTTFIKPNDITEAPASLPYIIHNFPKSMIEKETDRQTSG